MARESITVNTTVGSAGGPFRGEKHEFRLQIADLNSAGRKSAILKSAI
jgi:hypothetical protein